MISKLDPSRETQHLPYHRIESAASQPNFLQVCPFAAEAGA